MATRSYDKLKHYVIMGKSSDFMVMEEIVPIVMGILKIIFILGIK
jgi:hypothetical protein